MLRFCSIFAICLFDSAALASDIPTEANGLPGAAVTSSIENNLSEPPTDSFLSVGLRIDNSTNRFIDQVFIKCTGFANGQPVALGVGMASQIAPGDHAFTHAIFDIRDKTRPETAICRTTYAYPRR